MTTLVRISLTGISMVLLMGIFALSGIPFTTTYVSMVIMCGVVFYSVLSI